MYWRFQIHPVGIYVKSIVCSSIVQYPLYQVAIPSFVLLTIDTPEYIRPLEAIPLQVIMNGSNGIPAPVTVTSCNIVSYQAIVDCNVAAPKSVYGILLIVNHAILISMLPDVGRAGKYLWNVSGEYGTVVNLVYGSGFQNTITSFRTILSIVQFSTLFHTLHGVHVTPAPTKYTSPPNIELDIQSHSTVTYSGIFIISLI